MSALSLLGVFVCAKVLVLAGHTIPLSFWTAIAYFWQDLLAVLLFAALSFLVRRPWLVRTLYGATVLYVGINVPVARLLATPLTWPMLGATRGALADSIRHHLTPENLAFIALILITGITFPRLLRGIHPRVGFMLVIPVLLLIALGPLATSRIETMGRHRNALVALVSTAWPRVAPRYAGDDWRASPFAGGQSQDLSRFSGAAAGRHVVMIVLESAGAGYLRPFGAVEDPMPHLTALADQAILFENAMAVYPESIKGLFSVLCSRYPAFDIEAESYAQVTVPSLPAVLMAAGYRTALFHSGRFMYLGMDSIIQKRGYQILEDAGAISGHHQSSFGVDEPSTVRRLLAWVDSLHKGERFFISYLPIAGHHPYDAPDGGPFPDREEIDRYRNALHFADAALGELVRGLQARALDRNTLFVIFGDHGEAFGQHKGNYGHSLFLYEENIHVPYLIIAPGLVQEQIRVARVASLIDTAPTILDWLGVPLSRTYQGQSLLAGRNRMALFYTDYSLSFLGLRDGCWKYIYELESRRSKLFDLCTDRGEQNDRSAQHPERVAAYEERVRRWSAAQKALILEAQGAMSPPDN